MKSAAAIAFDYRPSRLLAAAVIAVTALAVASVALSGMAPWLKLIAGTAACGYSGVVLRAFLRAGPCRIAWLAAGHWRVQGIAGERTAELRGASVRGPWIVLRLYGNNRKTDAFVLAPDNSDADTRRRLRVRLLRPPQT
jgi:toxin CptA